MLENIKKWFSPLTEPSKDTVMALPERLPENLSVTYNAALDMPIDGNINDTVQESSTMPKAARWRLRRAPESNQVEDTMAEDAIIPDRIPDSAERYGSGYTLQRVIARGGFGEIWEATQEVLSRVVAVKRLRQDLIDLNSKDMDALSRLELAFRQEALVAAYLEHPNILPVHDLGMDEHGHLLLATKLVRGRTWDILLLEDRDLPIDVYLDRHLPILVEVARAVSFAHAKGVVHRDLKPSQVMVGEFGEVLLMDWGIALFTTEKRSTQEGLTAALHMLGPTQQMASNPAGTVGYMAPEQTQDTIKHIGTWTDVYLLGGILYELLTGRPPHVAENRHQAFFQAAVGNVPKPSDIVPNVELPPKLVMLAMVCLKPKPEERLSSVPEFIRLLDEYLSSATRYNEAKALLQKVSAHADPFPDYKQLAHDQSVLERALSLWPGYTLAERTLEQLTLRFAHLALENHDLKLARLQAERLPEHHPERAQLLASVEHLEDELNRAREKLEEAYRRTRAAHARADRLVTFLLDDLHTSLQAVNRLDLMGQVGREALEYFDTLSEDEASTDSMAKRAVASRNIGDVFRDQGNLEGAAAAFQTFQELAQRLLNQNPESTAWRALLASACERLSGIEYLRGNLDQSLTLLDKGHELTEPLLRVDSPQMEDRFLAAKLHHQKGIVLWRRRKLDQALPIQLESLGEFEKLADLVPERTEYRQSLAWNLSTLGNVYRDLGNLPEAIRQTEAGLAIRMELSEKAPVNKLLLDDVCWSLTNLALLREYTGDSIGALKTYEEAGELRRRLVTEDHTNIVHRNKLSFILSSKGRNLYGLGRYQEATAVTIEASDLSRKIAEADPTNMHEVGSHALNLGYTGLALYMSGDVKRAREVLAETQPAARRALATVPENGVFQNAVCQSLILEGLLARDENNPSRAKVCWEEALSLLEGQFWRKTTGQGMGMHMELCVYLDRREDARKDAEELLKNNWMTPRWQALLDKLPN